MLAAPRARLLAAPLLAASLACACGASRGGADDGGGGSGIAPRAELSLAGAASRGVLSYAVAFAGPPAPLLVSVELGRTFDLVARSFDPARGGALGERARVVLGPPDWDVSDLALVPGGRAALVASAAGTVREVDLAGARVTATWHLGAAATAVAVSPDGRLAATGSASGVLCLRRLADGALLQCLAAHGAAISGLDFDPAGARLASSSWDGHVAVWSVPALAALAELDVRGSANQLAFAPDGHSLAVATSAAPPRRTPEVAASERRGSGGGGAGAPLADPGARVLIWRPEPGGEPARELAGHRGPVTAVAWSADARHLVSASWDRTVRLWDVGTGRELARVSGFSHLLRDLAVARSGGWAAASAWAAGRDDPATVLLALHLPP